MPSAARRRSRSASASRSNEEGSSNSVSTIKMGAGPPSYRYNSVCAGIRAEVRRRAHALLSEVLHAPGPAQMQTGVPEVRILSELRGLLLKKCNHRWTQMINGFLSVCICVHLGFGCFPEFSDE